MERGGILARLDRGCRRRLDWLSFICVPSRPVFENHPRLALLGAVLAISTGSIFVRLSHSPPIFAAFSRCFVGALFYSVIAWRAGYFRRRPAHLAQAVAAGGFLALHLWWWIASLQLTSVAVSLLLLNVSPLWVTLLEAALTRKVPRARQLGAVLMGIAGCGFLAWGERDKGADSALGLILAMSSGLAIACYLVAGRRARQEMPLSQYVSVNYLSASALLLFVMAFSRGAWHPMPLASYGWLLAMALLPQIVGHTTVNWSLRFMPSNQVSLFLLLEPLIAGVAAYFLFAERLSIWAAPAAVLVVGSVLLSTTSPEPVDADARLTNDSSES